MEPIPLTSPDGTIYTYACGICHNVQGATVCFTPQVKELAESYREQAEQCCRCTRCRDRKAEESEYLFKPRLCAECIPFAAKEDAERRRINDLRDEQYQNTYNGSLKLAKDEAAAKQLAALMSDLSEERDAQWLTGLEHTLWQFVEDWRTGDVAKRSAKWGMFERGSNKLVQLSELSERAGGWWVWKDETDDFAGCGEVFVPMTAWLQKHKEHGLDTD
jgi:hypothetical protein